MDVNVKDSTRSPTFNKRDKADPAQRQEEEKHYAASPIVISFVRNKTSFLDIFYPSEAGGFEYFTLGTSRYTIRMMITSVCIKH